MRSLSSSPSSFPQQPTTFVPPLNSAYSLTDTTAHANNFNASVGMSFGKERASKYKGVYKCGRKWKAQVQISGVQHYLGVFEKEDDAAEAYANFQDKPSLQNVSLPVNHSTSLTTTVFTAERLTKQSASNNNLSGTPLPMSQNNSIANSDVLSTYDKSSNPKVGHMAMEVDSKVDETVYNTSSSNSSSISWPISLLPFVPEDHHLHSDITAREPRHDNRSFFLNVSEENSSSNQPPYLQPVSLKAAFANPSSNLVSTADKLPVADHLYTLATMLSVDKQSEKSSVTGFERSANDDGNYLKMNCRQEERELGTLPMVYPVSYSGESGNYQPSKVDYHRDHHADSHDELSHCNGTHGNTAYSSLSYDDNNGSSDHNNTHFFMHDICPNSNQQISTILGNQQMWMRQLLIGRVLHLSAKLYQLQYHRYQQQISSLHLPKARNAPTDYRNNTNSHSNTSEKVRKYLRRSSHTENCYSSIVNNNNNNNNNNKHTRRSNYDDIYEYYDGRYSKNHRHVGTTNPTILHHNDMSYSPYFLFASSKSSTSSSPFTTAPTTYATSSGNGGGSSSNVLFNSHQRSVEQELQEDTEGNILQMCLQDCLEQLLHYPLSVNDQH